MKNVVKYVECRDGARTQPSKTHRGHTGSTYGIANPGMDVVRNFRMSTGSITVFGVSAVAHSLLIAGVVGTVATFEVARAQPNRFISLGRGLNGEHE